MWCSTAARSRPVQPAITRRSMRTVLSAPPIRNAISATLHPPPAVGREVAQRAAEIGMHALVALERPVVAAVEHERIGVARRHAERAHAADEDDVIAALVLDVAL